MKAASLRRWLNSISLAARRGDRVAIVVNGKSIGTMVLMQVPTSAVFDIESAFYSAGTEDEQATVTRNLAGAIRKAIRAL